MKKLPIFFVLGLFVSMPLLCYTFLDQLYVRHFTDFGQKWIAREFHNLSKDSEALSQFLNSYREVILVSDDLKGFGFAHEGKIAESFGKTGPSLPKFANDVSRQVIVQRIGIFEYRTLISVGPTNSTIVFFVFEDDTAYVDLSILILTMLSSIGIALLSWIQFGRIREETIQKTTVRTIQGMAHDFRAPFGKLRIFMTQLQRLDSKVFSDLKDMRKDLDAAVDHADDILTDFLNLNSKTELMPFDCREMLERLKTKYFPTWKQDFPKVELVFDCPDAIWALGNQHKTLRVLFNLLDNALKHALSRVELSIKASDHKILFLVKNDGPAIEKRNLSKIFKPFYSKRQGGLGLGLFICETLVKSQGSTLKCLSKPNCTQFKFSLKATSQPQLIAKKSAHEATSNGYQVAYIDDEKFYLDAMATGLKDTPIVLTTFGDTDSFLMALKQGGLNLDLVLVDRYGPTFDAVEDRFQESCRDYGYAGPIVLYSNSVTNETNIVGFTKVFDKMNSLGANDIIRIIEELKHEEI